MVLVRGAQACVMRWWGKDAPSTWSRTLQYLGRSLTGDVHHELVETLAGNDTGFVQDSQGVA